jgi:hypothetical protein
MSQWPSVAFENGFLKSVAHELRKRSDAVRPLVSVLAAQRVDDIEDMDGQGGLPHERLDLDFTLVGDITRLRLTLYDDQTFYLNISPAQASPMRNSQAQGNLTLDGTLADPNPAQVAYLVEALLRCCLATAEPAQLRRELSAVFSR